MNRILLMTSAAFGLVVAASGAHAQSLTVRPAVLFGDGVTFGARITSELERTRYLVEPFPRSWTFAVRADAPVFLDRERNPETMRAQIDMGGLLSLFRPAAPVGGIASPADDPLDLGFLAAQITIGGETPQDFGTADVTVGGSVEYGHNRYQDYWFVPEIRVGWDAVFCVDCEVAVAGEDETGSRLQAEVAWNIPADRGWMPESLQPLWLRLRGRGFVTEGMEAALPLRNEDGLWGSAELAYRCDNCGWLHEMYVRGHAGRLPLHLREERAVTAGVSVAF